MQNQKQEEHKTLHVISCFSYNASTDFRMLLQNGTEISDPSAID